MTTFWTIILCFLIFGLALRLGMPDLFELLGKEDDPTTDSALNFLLIAATVLTLCLGVQRFLL